MSLIPFAGAVQKFNRSGGGAAGYQIERSLRFNSADSAYLNRTFTTPTNNKIFTFSAWVKRSALGAAQTLFDAFVPATSFDSFRFNSSDQLDYFDNTAGYLTSTQVFRDVGAWYHIMAAVDTTQATSSNRVKLYVNGTQITAFSASAYPSQNQAVIFNSAVAHGIGRFGYSANAYLNGYLTEINFIDGSALDPTSFGEFNETTGIWQPKAYEGEYGTNGFYLDFSDNTSTTTLGYDAAGSNDWTLNNFSVTAGAGNDSLVDTPTSYGTDTGVGGQVRGNYATMNPLQYSSTYAVLSNGNLNVAGASGVDAGGAFATAKVNSGKWYWEALILGTASTYPFLGFAVNTTGAEFQGGARIGTAGTPAIVSPESFIALNGSPSGTSFTTNDVLQFALDMDNGKMWIGKNGTWMNSGVPASGTGNMFSISDTSQYVSPYIFSYNTSSVAFNFGQRAFSYTAPSGFKALCTQNLPEPTIVDGGEYFNTVLYTGIGSTQSVTGVGFQPDFVWFKRRNSAAENGLHDAVRGVQYILTSDTTGAELDRPTYVTSFDSDGFSFGDNVSNYNASGSTYVAWNWNAGGSNATNTDGTITSTVRTNPTAGFSIVSWTGNATAGATIGHGLGVQPDFWIIKNRDNGTPNWMVGSQELTNPDRYKLHLNNNEAQGDWGSALWQTDSSVITLDAAVSHINGSGEDMIAYCFAAIPGYSAFGSYTGNGSTDGPFQYLGFRPAYILFKRTNGTGYWWVYDIARDTYNQMISVLNPNVSDAEASNAVYAIDGLSNGFKLRSTGSERNGSSDTYIYAAFSEVAFKYSLGR